MRTSAFCFAERSRRRGRPDGARQHPASRRARGRDDGGGLPRLSRSLSACAHAAPALPAGRRDLLPSRPGLLARPRAAAAAEPAGWRGRPAGRARRRRGRARPLRAGLDGLPARRLDGGRRSALRRADVLRRSLPDPALPGQSGRTRLRPRARAGSRRARHRVRARRVAAPPPARARRAPRALLRRARLGGAAAVRAVLLPALPGRRRSDTAPTRRSCAHGRAPRSSARSRETAPQTSSELSYEEAAALLGGQLGALLESRCEVVATLAGELAEATRARGARLELLDGSGAVKGYATGRPEGGSPRPRSPGGWASTSPPAPARAQRSARSPTRPTRPAWRSTSRPTERWRRVCPLVAALRPVPPDCDSAENLAAKLRAARRGGRRPRRHLPLRPGAADRARPRARGARARRADQFSRTCAAAARPGVAPVCAPPSSTSSPLTATYSKPSCEEARLLVGGDDRARHRGRRP